MKIHAAIGGKLLEGDDSTLMRMAREIALTHHEKWDGSGYPNGLAGEAIPQTGRIVALADVFDALTSVRPYKKACTVEVVMGLVKQQWQALRSGAGRVFLQELPGIVAIRERFTEPVAPG